MESYYPTLGDALDQISTVLEAHDMALVPANLVGDEGSKLLHITSLSGAKLSCCDCGKEVGGELDNGVALSWYRMPSGRYEVVAYVSL